MTVAATATRRMDKRENKEARSQQACGIAETGLTNQSSQCPAGPLELNFRFRVLRCRRNLRSSANRSEVAGRETANHDRRPTPIANPVNYCRSSISLR
jgi:hypothetical protein